MGLVEALAKEKAKKTLDCNGRLCIPWEKESLKRALDESRSPLELLVKTLFVNLL